MAGAKVGIAYFRINGQPYAVSGDAPKVMRGTREREELVGVDGRVHGFKETPKAPSIEATLLKMPGLNVGALQDIVDATVTLEMLDGHVFTLRNAFCAAASEVDPVEGKITTKFVGLDMQETVA